jgi:cellulose synthase/poly-beta-1,6-N-acetylglucosamine synthase-like glycosyltransferase
MEELLSPDAPPGDSLLSKPPATGSDTALSAPSLRIGEMLVEAGLITEAQVAEALAKQATWGSRLGDIILAMGWVKPLDFYKVLARHFKLQFVNLSEHRVDESLLDSSDYLHYAQHLYLPWRRENGTLWIATAEPGSRHLQALAARHQDLKFAVTSKFDILWELQRVAGPFFSLQATQQLAETDPERSAKTVITRQQKHVAGILLMVFVCLLYAEPFKAILLLNASVNLFLFLVFAFRVRLCLGSWHDTFGMSISDKEVDRLHDSELPVYSVLVPMYKEAEVLPILAGALRRMNYPPSKLDIKLVLEEDDIETINAAKTYALDATFEIIRVPYSEPRTKPKACNYALRLARGKYLTIYDAEDQPEPNQLKRAVLAFRRRGKKTACIQAHLNYYNADENWLTRLFTLEYSVWFDIFLPALERLRVPIPLGGTSNHFDLEKLREVGGWDPFNVTEDADLGLRFAALGYDVAVIDSVTYEEANSQVRNWTRQRSRWIKGYIQTWLVNMRHPWKLYQQVGLRGLCALQLFIAGTFVSGLAYPVMLIPFLIWTLFHSRWLAEIYPPAILLIGGINLMFGNGCAILLSILAVGKRKKYWLIPSVLLIPIYWLLQSLSAYKALIQLIAKPFYWEKTVHGISKFTQAEIAQAGITSN